MRARRLLRVGLNVASIDAARGFYEQALGFVAAGEAAEADPALAALFGCAMRTLRLRLGAQELELAEFVWPGAPYPADSTGTDLWFQHVAVATGNMQAAHAAATRAGAVPITEGGPQTLPPATGSVTAWKFRDPEGHPFEFLHFPPGTGDAAWQATGATLGYDHSAISVADAERSISFYAGLGLAVASRQVNSGPEQERLDAAPGVQVDVVALQPEAGTPHLELLGYRYPRGRAAPLGPRDIAATRLVLEVDRLEGGGLPLASGSRAALRQDPDGHFLLLVEPTAQ